MPSGKKKGIYPPKNTAVSAMPPYHWHVLSKLIFTNNDTLKASVEVAHYGSSPLQNATTGWTLRDTEGNILQSGQWNSKEIPVGNNFTLGEVAAPLTTVTTPQRLILEVQ